MIKKRLLQLYRKPLLMMLESRIEKGFALSVGGEDNDLKYDNGGDAW